MERGGLKDGTGSKTRTWIARRTNIFQDGRIQLWSLQDSQLLDEAAIPSKVWTVVWVPDTPYICLGCESGLLFSLQLLTATGDPAEGTCQAASLEVLVYECETPISTLLPTLWVAYLKLLGAASGQFWGQSRLDMARG